MKKYSYLFIFIMLILLSACAGPDSTEQPPPTLADKALEANWQRVVPPKGMENEVCWIVVVEKDIYQESAGIGYAVCDPNPTSEDLEIYGSIAQVDWQQLPSPKGMEDRNCWIVLTEKNIYQESAGTGYAVCDSTP